MPRRRSTVQYFIAACVGATLFSEWFVYIVQPVFWPVLKCQDEAACTRILFIADPQIQGEYAEPYPWNEIYAWDSDRYLRSTFNVAAGRFRPNILVYLGDLTDEGSIATLVQFHEYAKRLLNIFQLDYPFAQIWLPGDNDIGGENEPIKWNKVSEFKKIFEQPDVITRRNISFYKVNGITHHYPSEAEGDGDFKIVVSHYPVTNRHVFGQQVNSEIRPNIYFCAHDHESKYVKQDSELAHRQTHWLARDGAVLSVPADGDSLYEVYVPTCSYRMGTDDIGFGAAVLDHYTRELRYTVFWSPRRFPYLFIYAVFLTITVLYFIAICCNKLLKLLLRPSKAWSADKVPLLT